MSRPVIIGTFSGGKDSLAEILWIRENLTKDFITVFCDSDWESEITMKHIHEVTEKLNLDLRILKSRKYDGMKGLASKKGRFPSSRRRFCTEELKSKPMIDFILDEVKGDCIIVQGIRAGESKARAAMSKQCRFFKYYFEPYGYDKNNKPKYHTYRAKEVKEFCSKYTDDILRPVFEWTAQQVIDYIVENGLEPNPLYKMGFNRVGCFPCIMCNKGEVKQLANRFPERIKELSEIESEIGSSFFPPDYIPERYCSQTAINKKGEKVKFPLVKDVVDYVMKKNGSLDLFNEPTSCMSFYGLCE